MALAASAAIAVLLLPDRKEQVQTKGALSLEVYRERAGNVVRASQNDTFSPGDRLRSLTSELLIVQVCDGFHCWNRCFTMVPYPGTFAPEAWNP